MKNWRTFLSALVAALGLVPTAIDSLHLETVPNWVKVAGYVCMFVGTVLTGLLAKDKNVTGVGDTAQTKSEIENKEY